MEQQHYKHVLGSNQAWCMSVSGMSTWKTLKGFVFSLVTICLLPMYLLAQQLQHPSHTINQNWSQHLITGGYCHKMTVQQWQ